MLAAQAEAVTTDADADTAAEGVPNPAPVSPVVRAIVDAEGARHSTQHSTSREPLVPPHMARQMRPGDALLVHGTLPPAHVRALPWWSERRLSRRARHRPAPGLPLPAPEEA